MIEQDVPVIKEYLRQRDVQERIQKSMQEVRAKATVTISQAAKLFGLTESQIRDWEKRGLLSTERSLSTEASKGHRQFSPDVLNKLAIIKELKDNGGYSLGAIPQNVDSIWDQTVHDHQVNATQIVDKQTLDTQQTVIRRIPIDKRVEQAEKETSWRYFTSQALRLSLILACENIPETVAGLVLPLRHNTSSSIVHDPHRLPEAGECLIGWLDLSGSFYAFLDPAPSFEVPTDFRIQPLVAAGEEIPYINPLIVVQRKARPLNLSVPAVETIRSLLKPIYENIEHCKPAFDYGMRDWLYQATDFANSIDPTDDVLNNLADVIIQMGDKTALHEDHWRFCCLLLPDDDTLPIRQRKLIVRAQSERSPYIVGTSTVSSEFPGLSLRAYQSGYVIYRPDMSVKDFVIAYQDKEKSTRSAIAIPLAGEDGLSIAVLYIASNEVNAFPIEKQRVLRMVCKMAEELLMTYSARRQVTGRLADVIMNPGLVDISFRNFLSENDFVNDVEELLTSIHLQDKAEGFAEEVASFIAIDIDNQSSLATRLGDHVARNLSRAVGSRILGQLSIFSPELRRLFHVSADRYCLFLKGMKLNEARNLADNLHNALVGEYRIDARHAIVSRQTPRERQFELPNVTVRLGVLSYKYSKLKEVLGRYSVEPAVAEVRTLIMNNLDLSLETGQVEDGDCIISWDPEIWSFRRWSPSEDA